MPNTSLLFVCYPRCSTCRKARTWLDEHDVSYDTRHIVEENPSLDELSAWWKTSGLPLRKLFNTSGKLYRELGMKNRFAEGISEQECLEMLSSNGMLVKRPLLVGEDFVLVGFNERQWSELLLANE